MRLRTSKDRLKIEHSIIDGVRAVLEELLAANPEIRSVIPGVIRPVRDARGKVKVRVTVPTQNGWKAIALSAGARQELFVSTAMGKAEQELAGRIEGRVHTSASAKKPAARSKAQLNLSEIRWVSRRADYQSAAGW